MYNLLEIADTSQQTTSKRTKTKDYRRYRSSTTAGGIEPYKCSLDKR